MIYKNFKELKTSWLGMGNMRLPKIEGQNEKINENEAQKIIEYAYQSGVNYFDTAYRYHSGESETFVGKVLQQYPRDTFYLATKIPGHMMIYKNGTFHFTGFYGNKPSPSPMEIFEEQLEKCRVDYFDFYLLHNLCETSYDFYTNEEIGVITYLLEQKKRGRIKHFGFSSHGRPETIDTFLNWSKERFGNCFEFVQIQLNYLDWTLQEAWKKYEIITNHGLPVISMESCLGGRLASLGDKTDTILKQKRPHNSIVSWAFRFLQSLPNVQMVLSGMSTMEQIRENVAIFSTNDPTTAEEKKLLDEVVKPMLDMVPCTGCRYCCESCPKKLDIPKLIALYNEEKNADHYLWPSIDFTIDAMNEAELPAACIACDTCTKLCPQGIEIPDVLKKFAQLLAKRRKL